MTLLAGLIFYVYNLGTEVNRRMSLQHASDSAAIGGAVGMARAFNTIAMNNCESARVAAMVPIFDSLPLASQMAYGEMLAWEGRLTNQLEPNNIPLEIVQDPSEYSLFVGGLTSLRARFVRQREILEGMDRSFNRSGFDMRSTTWWQPPGGSASGHGEFWDAMRALDDYSRATVESAGVFAQSEAVHYGKQNRADVAFVVPVRPTVPAVRTGFWDFRPVLEGNECVYSGYATEYSTGFRGGAIPDKKFPHRLGPWARLWRWRKPIEVPVDWEYVPGSPGSRGPILNMGGHVGPPDQQSGKPPWSTDGSTSGWVPRVWEVRGYQTYGPYYWAMTRLRDYTGRGWRFGVLPDSFFSVYMNQLSRAKLTYMFGSQSPQSIHKPEWIVDYDQAQQIGRSRPGTVRWTIFYKVDVISSVPEGSPGWLTPGTCMPDPEPIVQWRRRWVNTEDPTRWPIPKIGNYVWKDTYTYETTHDTRIGIPLSRDATGRAVWQKVYVASWYVWGGIDVGGTVPVENPCNWPSQMVLPAPWLLDSDVGEYGPDPDQDDRRKVFSFLGVARNHAGAPSWSAKFRRALPDAVTAVAQAKVFNHSSWDLWTQDWEAQLTPVSQWPDWMDQMDRGADDAGGTGGLLTPEDVRSAGDYLRRLQELADSWINH